MHYRHVTIIDRLLQNAIEETRCDADFNETLIAMSETEREELPAILISRFEIINDRLSMSLSTPSIEQAACFVERRLEALTAPDSKILSQRDDELREALCRDLEEELLALEDDLA